MTLTGNTFFYAWETGLMQWLQAHLGGGTVSAISFLSVFGEELMLILVMGFLYWGYDKRLGKQIGLTVLMGTVWNPMCKNLALRRRPYMDHEGIGILRVVNPEADAMDIAAQGYSFPSGHSTNAMALYASLAAKLRKRWAIALAVVVPLLVGVSRVVVGAHYPTDVLGGWLLGLAAAVLVPWLQRKIKSPAVLYAVLLASAIPGVFYCRSDDYFSALGLLVGFIVGTSVEEKYICFQNTRNVLRAVLRVVGGAVLFFALNKLLKLPFSEAFLGSGSPAAMFVRFARYGIIAFLEFGAYPLAFRFAAKIGAKA